MPMYRHMLVPIDASDLSIQVVGNAVEVARSVGARVTFLHARADAAGGKAHELLAKAEAAARACGVPCASHCSAGAEPATAIVGAARERGCDLIFMPAPADATLAVLRATRLPVLVAPLDEPGAHAHAIGVIRDEHRAIAAVMHAWLDALSAARTQAADVDVMAMRLMLRYLQQFAAAVHHPKEEAQLFRRLRRREPALAFELDELQRQHRRDAQLLAGLAHHLDVLADTGGAALDELERAVQAYAEFLWNHLGREEAVILPAAQRCLRAHDWREIDAAFARQRDALLDESCAELFARIVSPDAAVH